ncbi:MULTISPECIES: DUF3613 domain-containing protein [Pseudomonas]|uniref:DUF3613 domain-containing protein n=1 Tax=Pseudomonas muyukensis TaxID=2842357 RepID=A0ABX8MCT0_9PSED|nr:MULTISPECIES: DUF3613 domain-containing protein [Pseudomonas]MCO7518923.1 DUF3613 domain-containing protein [Pseudomonas sp. 1]MCO7541296.1 DUF3613 domain-containing protein [Pseudomonas sp. VA159-2]QXH36392.1 DUF3613 domain-containing protein [Pseudomonas muyukensis]
MFKQAIVLACAITPLLALADPDAQAPTATEALLQVQASNRQASPVRQVQTDKERDQAMQRWLDSYKYAIPDFYRWTKINSSNNGG